MIIGRPSSGNAPNLSARVSAGGSSPGLWPRTLVVISLIAVTLIPSLAVGSGTAGALASHIHATYAGSLTTGSTPGDISSLSVQDNPAAIDNASTYASFTAGPTQHSTSF